jgi:hypothetical protein
MKSEAIPPTETLFRPPLERAFGSAVAVAMAVFVVHAVLRFIGALTHGPMLAVAMALVWPLPWLLMGRSGRQAIGVRRAEHVGWYAAAILLGVAAVGVTAGIAGLCFGGGADNWLLRHAADLNEIAKRLPPASPSHLFWMLALPAMIFSPLGEEILYRGFLQTAFGRAAGARAGRIVPALLFGFAHLSQFGLLPLQPPLLVVWLPSMFAVALLFGWVRERSGSLYSAVMCHAAFNLALTAAAWP